MAASRRAFVAAAARYMPGLSVDDLDGTSHAGVRAQAVGRDGGLVDDFVFSRQRGHPRPQRAVAGGDIGLRAGREIVARVTSP